jgi:hypothetical protein
MLLVWSFSVCGLSVAFCFNGVHYVSSCTYCSRCVYLLHYGRRDTAAPSLYCTGQYVPLELITAHPHHCSVTLSGWAAVGRCNYMCAWQAGGVCVGQSP